jgi:hypothetical protein
MHVAKSNKRTFCIDTLAVASLPAGAAAAHHASECRCTCAAAAHCGTSETRTVEFCGNKDFRALRVAPLAVGRRPRLLQSAAPAVPALAISCWPTTARSCSTMCRCSPRRAISPRRSSAPSVCACRTAMSRCVCRRCARLALGRRIGVYCGTRRIALGAGTDWRAAASRSPPSRTASSTATTCWCARASRCGSSACFCSWCAKAAAFPTDVAFLAEDRRESEHRAVCIVLSFADDASRSHSRLSSSLALMATAKSDDSGDDECAQASLRRRWRRRRRWRCRKRQCVGGIGVDFGQH